MTNITQEMMKVFIQQAQSTYPRVHINVVGDVIPPGIARQYIRDGIIVLNIAKSASDTRLGADMIHTKMRFGGVQAEMTLPYDSIRSVTAWNDTGTPVVSFVSQSANGASGCVVTDLTPPAMKEPEPAFIPKRPKLTVVK